jgi:metal-responsive CopG/Arc/MetJ family transcriptional regulator
MARTRAAAKAETPQSASVVKFNLTLPADLARRFGVHAEMLGIKSKSEMFAELVRTGCKRYVVHDHGGKESTGEGETA